MNVTLGSNNNILESLKGGSPYGKVHSLKGIVRVPKSNCTVA